MVSWSLAPSLSRAVYVPDANDNPGVWVPLNSYDPAPSGGPDMSLDENNVEVWRAQFVAARDSGAIAFWSGGTWVVNGVSQSYNGLWHVGGAGDADNDGIPEDLDPYPEDITNNSFYWSGGAFTKLNSSVGNIYHIFRAGWYAGAATDANADNLPDVLDDWFINPSNHGTLQQFPGGTFLIEGAYSTFDPFSYYAPAWADADGDLLPDELDPFPSDAWNATYYDWPGGDYRIDGVLTSFAAARYNGLLADADGGVGDGIPDVADPYPLDPANNSALWQGGQFIINGVTQNLPAAWHRADAVDADNDSIPDDIDPYPGDAGNPTTLPPVEFYWGGGTFRIDGQEATFAAGNYSGTWNDQDSDGIPDTVDAYLQDAANNSAWWPGGTFTIAGQSQTLSGQWHRADSGDGDSDTIPDDLDPYPSDSNNGTTPPSYWAGGTFIIDGQSVPFAAQYYTGDGTDSDNDTIPNFADPYPSDNTNNSFEWAGGETTLNGIFVRFGSTWFAGSATDGNSNSVPDSLEDWFADPSPHGTLQQWSGGTFTIDGQSRTWPELKYYASGLNDADLDTIPDEIDPYPADQGNNSGFTWPVAQTTLLYGNVQTVYNPTLYGGTFGDADGDTIPDVAETAAYVNDPWNGNDTDGDGIPDNVEVLYPGTLDYTNYYDAGYARSDGITYLRMHQYNVAGAARSPPIPAIGLTDPFPMPSPERDTDGDSMYDRYEVQYGLNPFDALDSVGSAGNDLLFNFEKISHAADPAVPVPPENYANFTSQSRAEVEGFHNSTKSAEENDWDGDLVANIDEVLLFGTDARASGSRPSDAQIIAAIVGSQLLSATTLINFQYLVTPCGCGNKTSNPATNHCGCANAGGCTNGSCYTPPACECGKKTTDPTTNHCGCANASSCTNGNCYTPPCECGNKTNDPNTNHCGCANASSCTNGSCYTPPCVCSYTNSTTNPCPGAGCTATGHGTSSCACGDGGGGNPCGCSYKTAATPTCDCTAGAGTICGGHCQDTPPPVTCGALSCACGTTCPGVGYCSYQLVCPCEGTQCLCNVTPGCRSPANFQRPCSTMCSPPPPVICECGCGVVGCTGCEVKIKKPCWCKGVGYGCSCTKDGQCPDIPYATRPKCSDEAIWDAQVAGRSAEMTRWINNGGSYSDPNIAKVLDANWPLTSAGISEYQKAVLGAIATGAAIEAYCLGGMAPFASPVPLPDLIRGIMWWAKQLLGL